MLSLLSDGSPVLAMRRILGDRVGRLGAGDLGEGPVRALAAPHREGAGLRGEHTLTSLKQQIRIGYHT